MRALILAALAALCAAPAANATFYRAKDATIACASLSDMQEVIKRARIEGEEAAYRHFVNQRLSVGACVFPAEGQALIIEEFRGEFARVTITSDPRPLWVFAGSVDWSAR
jgi:hypothetical protein